MEINLDNLSPDQLKLEICRLNAQLESNSEGGQNILADSFEDSELTTVYKAIVNYSDDLIAISTFDMSPVYTYISPSHFRKLGFKPTELIGQKCFDLIHPQDKYKLIPIIKKYLSLKLTSFFNLKQKEYSERFEFRVLDKQNNWHYLDSIAKFISKNRILFISRDVTEDKKIEEELRQHREHLKELVNEKTKDLEKKNLELIEKNKELEKYHDLFVKREFRINELKQKLRDFEKKQ